MSHIPHGSYGLTAATQQQFNIGVMADINDALLETLCCLVVINIVNLESNEWWHVAYATNLFPSDLKDSFLDLSFPLHRNL